VLPSHFRSLQSFLDCVANTKAQLRLKHIPRDINKSFLLICVVKHENIPGSAELPWTGSSGVSNAGSDSCCQAVICGSLNMTGVGEVSCSSSGASTGEPGGLSRAGVVVGIKASKGEMAIRADFCWDV
jgi:hypothetical protein